MNYYNNAILKLKNNDYNSFGYTMRLTIDQIKEISWHLKNNTNIETIILLFNDITDNGVKEIFNSLRCNNCVSRIFLNHSKKIGCKGAKYIASYLMTNTSIGHLSL